MTVGQHAYTLKLHWQGATTENTLANPNRLVAHARSFLWEHDQSKAELYDTSGNLVWFAEIDRSAERKYREGFYDPDRRGIGA